MHIKCAENVKYRLIDLTERYCYELDAVCHFRD